jgi:exosortase
MTQATVHTPTRPDLATQLRAPIAASVVLLGLLTWLFWDFFSRQFRWAIEEQADWGHTLIVPLISGYFVYLNRQRLLAQPFKTAWTGFIPIIAGLGIYTLCSLGPLVLSHHNLRGLGVGLTVFGLVLLFCGYRAMAVLWFPLVYMFVFGQTISYRVMELVTFEMQDITARGAHVALTLFGLEVDREGNTLYIFSDGEKMPLNIAEACSGMRMLMAFLALGVAMAYTGLKRAWQRVVIVILGVPTAIFVNILRVCSLGLLSLIDTEFAAGDFHSFVGLVWLLPAFLIYLGLIWIVRNVVTEGDDAAATT